MRERVQRRVNDSSLGRMMSPFGWGRQNLKMHLDFPLQCPGRVSQNKISVNELRVCVGTYTQTFSVPAVTADRQLRVTAHRGKFLIRERSKGDESNVENIETMHGTEISTSSDELTTPQRNKGRY